MSLGRHVNGTNPRLDGASRKTPPLPAEDMESKGIPETDMYLERNVRHWHLVSSTMYSLFLLCSLIAGTFADTNPNFTVNVGGSNPPITSPQVIGFDALNGNYKHVVILSIDGFHSVIPFSSHH